MKRLAIITTHPIQYNAPLFRLLSERKNIEIKVFYTWGQSSNKIYDARFGRERSWDIPLLDGYEHEFVRNSSKRPDSNSFFGVINPGFLKKLKTAKFDAVLVLRWDLWSHLLIMQSFGNQPRLFFRGDSQWMPSGNPIKKLLKKWLLRFVYRRVDEVFYVGALNRDYFMKCGLQANQLISAPHAVDNVRFFADESLYEKKALEERAKLGITANTVVFVYAGKFYALKQLDVLIEAFQQLKGEQYRLVFYGSGELEHQLKEKACNDRRILFAAFKNQSEMPWVYRTGDVFVLPSKHETWGLSVNEAMASGRPVIASNRCGCVPELILEGTTGFVFSAGSSKDLLKQLQKFQRKEVAAEMGKNAKMHIRKFSLEAVAAAFEKSVLVNQDHQ